MRIGIPKSLFFYRYKPFVTTFFSELDISVEYGSDSGKKTLDLGSKYCVDEACFPVKLFHGHAKSLAESCDFVAVPRLMKTEFGESICPKFCGLPELVASGGQMTDKLIFTKPIALNQKNALYSALYKDACHIGIDSKQLRKALAWGTLAQKCEPAGLDETGYRYKIFLAGHPYLVHDAYANLNLIEKLHAMDIGIITEERVGRLEKEDALQSLLKRPYWDSFVNSYGAAVTLARKKAIHGIICVSSFSCGTDSVTVEIIKTETRGLPMLVLKLDEQTGEAGYDTRLEAFHMILRARENQKSGRIRRCAT